MLELIGFLICVFVMIWSTIFLFALSITTFEESIFSGTIIYKFLGCTLWIADIYLWFLLFSMVVIK